MEASLNSVIEHIWDPMWSTLDPEDSADSLTTVFILDPSDSHSDADGDTLSSLYSWSSNSSISSLPSEIFPSLAIDTQFNLWSPTPDDDKILGRMMAESSHGSSQETSQASDEANELSDSESTLSTSSTESDSQCWEDFESWDCVRKYAQKADSIDAGQTFDLSECPSSISHWESDSFEWGNFKEWHPMPNLAEAEVLLGEMEKQEKAIRAQAAMKRAIKKAKFFARVWERKRHLRIGHRSAGHYRQCRAV